MNQVRSLNVGWFYSSVILFQVVNVCVRVCAWMFHFFFLPKVILICSTGAGVSEAALIGWDLKSPPMKLKEPRTPDQHTQFSLGIDWSNLSRPRGHWTGLPGSDGLLRHKTSVLWSKSTSPGLQALIFWFKRWHTSFVPTSISAASSVLRTEEAKM